MQFGYTIIYVPDVAATVAFYEAAFGLDRRFIHESGQYAEMETGGTALAFAAEDFTATCHLFEANRQGGKPPGAEVAFVTDNVQADFDRAVAAGALSVVEPLLKPWGQTMSYVRDLNGFLVEICSEVSA